MDANDPRDNDLDALTRRRLARLAGVPVDTTRLAARLRAEMGEPAQSAARRGWRLGSWRAVASLAAAVVLAGLIGIAAFELSTSPATAAPIELVDLHRELLTSHNPALLATSLDDANRQLTAQAAGDQRVPAPPHCGQRASCCDEGISGKLRACVRLDAGGRPVTLVVAEGADPCSSHGRLLDRAGRKYLVHMMGQVNMAMTAREGKWLCVMGELPDEELLQIAAAIKF